jgi:hypothetical protein
LVVPRRWGGVDVNIILNEARAPHLTKEGEYQPGRFSEGWRG